MLKVFTAHWSDKLLNEILAIPARFFYPLHRHSVPSITKDHPKSLQNTYEPLTSSPYRLTANSHPLNGTCHGSACPLTKDNCDLDKHWGEKHKGKGQVLFQFKCAPIHLQHNGDKELQLPLFVKGRWLPASRWRRKMLILGLIHMKIRGRSFITNQQKVLVGTSKQTPPHLLLTTNGIDRNYNLNAW